MARLAYCSNAVVIDIQGNNITLNGEVVITDYDNSPPVSMLWELDRTPITKLTDIIALLSGPAVAQPLPPLGVFFKKDVEAAVNNGMINVTGSI